MRPGIQLCHGAAVLICTLVFGSLCLVVGSQPAGAQGLSVTSAAEREAPKVTPIYIGGGLNIGMHIHTLDVPIYRNDTFCGVFTSGKSTLPSGYLTFEMPLGDPAHPPPGWYHGSLQWRTLRRRAAPTATAQRSAKPCPGSRSVWVR